MPPPRPKPLPSKEQSLFKSAMRLYETKHYKRALRNVEQILKTRPDHGETLAMKGLILNGLDRKAEANELVREGLKVDLFSHVCWHVYGLLFRSDRNYVEAARAYMRALSIDKENVQILRDLALLQIQIRDYDRFNATRRTLLDLKPGQKNNWIGYALSNHLIGNYDTAIRVIDSYERTLTGTISESNDEKYEKSELHLYRAWLYEESGNMEGVISYLDANEKEIVDPVSVSEQRARAYIALRDVEHGRRELDKLIRRNAESEVYLEQLRELAFIEHSTHDGEREQRAIAVCDEVSKLYPDALLPRRLPLSLLSDGGEDFQLRLEHYVQWFLRRGVPSLSTDLKPLYGNSSKVATIERLFHAYETSLRENGGLPSLGDEHNHVDAKHSADGDKGDTLYWVLYFLAMHYIRVPELEKALAYANMLIGLDASGVEGHLARARTLKHMGALGLAVESTDTARKLDLADRYLNSKSAKYAIRAAMMSEAEAWLSLFTRDGESGGIQALYDMQCMWYECEAGESYLRQGQLGPAMKKFTAVDRHFTDFLEDQFDFHSYCLRKQTMCSYVKLLRMEDSVRSKIFFVRAAKGLVRLHLLAHDSPDAINRSSTDKELAEKTAKMSVAQRRRQQLKERKAKKKADAKAAEQQQQQAKKGKNSGQSRSSGPHWTELDPDGEALIHDVADHLEAAAKFARELSSNTMADPETHVLMFQVALRRRRYLMALRAVLQCHSRHPESPESLTLLANLVVDLDPLVRRADDLSEPARTVLARRGSRALLNGRALEEVLYERAQRHAESMSHRSAAGIGILRCCERGAGAAGEEASSWRDRALALVMDLSGKATTWQRCADVREELEKLSNVDDAIRHAYAEACRERFPRAEAFHLDDEAQ